MTKKNILFIDEDSLLIKIIGTLLSDEFKVTGKNSEAEALDYLRIEAIPDLIILNMDLPGLNGKVFIEKIRTFPEMLKIPVIFTSVKDGDEFIVQFKNLQVKDNMVKLAKIDELIYCINRDIQ